MSDYRLMCDVGIEIYQSGSYMEFISTIDNKQVSKVKINVPCIAGIESALNRMVRSRDE